MDDKTLMENLLLTTKGVCDLYLHGCIEASNESVKQTFNTALDKSLKMQKDIYAKMEANGWYPKENAEQQQINKTKTKFQAQ
ncbi:MAG: spore coat protein [Ruminococcaceae bacterium]|nr:spore coat protein [Oscillospiraceae bacterium]